MQGWIIAWRYVGVWFPQQLCTELYNPLGTTAGSWRRAHIDIRGEKNARLSSPPNFGRMLHMQDHSRNLTVLFSCSLVLLTTLENAGTVTWDEMRRPEAERSISNKAASQVGGDSPDTGWGVLQEAGLARRSSPFLPPPALNQCQVWWLSSAWGRRPGLNCFPS